MAIRTSQRLSVLHDFFVLVVLKHAQYSVWKIVPALCQFPKPAACLHGRGNYIQKTGRRRRRVSECPDLRYVSGPQFVRESVIIESISFDINGSSSRGKGCAVRGMSEAI